MPDKHLRWAVREILGPAPDALLMLQALENLTELYVDYQEIRSLRGLEYAMGLEVLNLFWNQGIDITPLVGLTRLQELGLYHNKITDITPLDGM